MLCTKLDRLTRSVRDLGTLLEDHFGEDGAGLIVVGESVDTRTAAGRLVLIQRSPLESAPSCATARTSTGTSRPQSHARVGIAGQLRSFSYSSSTGQISPSPIASGVIVVESASLDLDRHLLANPEMRVSL